MKVLPGFATESEAAAKSEAIFAPYRHPSSQTRYLLSWRYDETSGTWGLIVPADCEALLPEEDRAAMVPYVPPPIEEV